MQHGLNEYRPHQARETLMILLEKQINTKKDMIQQLKAKTNEIQQQLLEIKGNLQ